MDQRKVVLFVDDEIQARIAGSAYLRDAGFMVVEATNAAEALAIFESQTVVDIVFTDIKMPGAMDGAALAHWIRQNHPDVPVLLTSGVTDLRAVAMETWGRNFIPKPFIFATVEWRIRELLDNAQRR